MVTNNENKSEIMNPQSDTANSNNRLNINLKEEGFKILDSMSEEERRNLGDKSNTLHFVKLLGLASKLSTKTKYNRDGVRYYDKAPQPIGVTLNSEIDIEIPVLQDVTKDKNTGINIDKDISYRTVKAGEDFHLTYYEFMYLIIRPEYSGFCEALGVPYGLYLSVKRTAYEKVKAKLPTPTLNFDKSLGSIRAHITPIDYKTQQDKWVVLPEYERFSPFLKNRNKKRKFDHDRIKKIAIALQEELGKDNIAQCKFENEKTIVSRGVNVLRTISNERRRKLGSKSSKLHLINLLVLKRKVDLSKWSEKSVGMTLVSDEDIQVPVIDVLKNNKTGINPSTDISYRTVKAGEQFIISIYEYMYLIIRDEYVGFCSFDEDKDGAYFLPNFGLYFSGQSKLPYPVLHSSYNYNPESVNIYQESEDGAIKIKSQYVESFGSLIR